jgi:hypothetical protein
VLSFLQLELTAVTDVGLDVPTYTVRFPLLLPSACICVLKSSTRLKSEETVKSESQNQKLHHRVIDRHFLKSQIPKERERQREAMSTLRALTFGSTGQVGREVLASTLSSPAFSAVLSAGRRPVTEERLPAEGKEKLRQESIDFEHPDEGKLKGFAADAVIIRYVPFLSFSHSLVDFWND